MVCDHSVYYKERFVCLDIATSIFLCQSFFLTYVVLSCITPSLFINTSLDIVLSYLCLPVVRSGHWYQGSPVCQAGLALPEAPGGLSFPAPRVVRVLFGPTLQTGRGSGSVWSYSETSGLQEVEEENSLK